MLEKDMIQSYGFRNVSAGDQVTGFQIRIRIPYYRGVWASLVEGADVTVDGEEFSRDTILWTLGDKTFTLPELEAASDVRWPFDEPAVLTVPKMGDWRSACTTPACSWPSAPPTCRPTWDLGSLAPRESSR